MWFAGYVAVMFLWQTDVFAGGACTDIDNFAEVLKQKPRATRSVQWSHAFTAADLLSHRYGVRVSATDLGLGSMRTILTSAEQKTAARIGASGSSHLDQLLANGAQRGVCLESQLMGVAGKLARLEQELDKQAQVILQERREAWRNRGDFGRKIDARPCRGPGLVDVSSLSPAFFATDFVEVSELKKNLRAVEAIHVVACKQKMNLRPSPQIASERGRGAGGSRLKQELIDIVDRQLEGKNIVGIVYRPEFMIRSPQRASQQASQLASQLASQQASTVVARRRNETSRKCEYLLRNAYETCPVQSGPAVRGPASVSENTSANTYKYPCVDGHIWVPDTDLAPHLDEVIYLKK